jgi:hypothetical protein
MRLFILGIFITISGWCQAQCDGINKEIDKFSGETTLSTGFIQASGYTRVDIILFKLEKKNGSLSFIITVDKGTPTCFEKGTIAIVLFKGGGKDTLVNTLSLNCKGFLSFDLSNYDVSRFVSDRITDIRFFGTDGYFDVELYKPQIEEATPTIQKYFSCLRNK